MSSYLDIVDDERIVYAYTMAQDGRVHSASLVTVLLAPKDGGTRLTFTEQGAYFAPTDGAAGRAAGWTSLLDHLVHTVS